MIGFKFKIVLALSFASEAYLGILHTITRILESEVIMAGGRCEIAIQDLSGAAQNTTDIGHNQDCGANI